MHPTSLLKALLLTTTANAATPAYSIVEPTQGAIVSLGTATVIKWNTTEPNSDKVSFFLETTTNSTSLFTIASNISNSGSISWAPPSSITTGTNYIVVLQPSSDSDCTEYKSSAFTISASNASTTYYPTEGEEVKTGQTTIITWKVDSNVTNVSIYLMEGSGTSDLTNVTTITTDIANSGDVACILASSVKSGNDYKFAIVDTEDPSSVLYSETFTVVNEGGNKGSSGSASGSATSTSSSTASSGSESTSTSTSGASRVWMPFGWVVALVVVPLLC
ncbi:hypothetical protein BO94DRAFT_623206 [Aspergillus sclerotioniger CBS 115572]|uniref:Yeast cell wall synthesis Kre9/Knh1-like N-terminal domain-containing protein n=1 Tax=Aspergillus sclerotioniger CBS 115572 TaxID=1450535 RepID=A0A317WVI5_9EURO|nr:hypothetical protein BO94DRAFT_623206 [Aspergillus sclerotioniger CBS 115572]PWY90424.1 hypothetical protein BO94DRAFT_623206 [Aspergillus sclerotioniger CBS 115572]